MKIENPGLFKGMLAEDYFDDCCVEPSLSQSLCKILIEQSPLHARQAHPRLALPVEGQDEDSTYKYDKAKAIGNAAIQHHAITKSTAQDASCIRFTAFHQTGWRAG